VLVGPLIAAVVLAMGLTLFNNHVLPESNHAFANLLIDIGRMRPTVKLQEGVFITDFPGYNMLVQSVNGRTNEMRGITIYQLNPGGPPTTIIARRGFLSYTPDGRTAVLELKDGEIHDIPAEEGGTRRYRRLVFKTHVINIQGAGGILERTVRNARSDREMSARALLVQREGMIRQFERSLESRRTRLRNLGIDSARVDALLPQRGSAAGWVQQLWGRLRGQDPIERLLEKAPALRTEAEVWKVERDAYRTRISGLSVEIHKKFSLPAACVVFVLLGAPIGMRVRRAGPAVAFLSVAFFLFYWLCLIGGEELANRLIIPAWLAMWLPNIVLGVIGLIGTLRACEVRLPWEGRRRRLRTPRREPATTSAAA
jgi:lipopolysaccharide export system permease protein